MKRRRWAVIQFPGSNCDLDTLKVFKKFDDVEPVLHWHEDEIEKNEYEVIALPGGFSFGDYLRAGAIAKLSRALYNLDEVAQAGAHILGICNGFQILLEAQLLPGYLHVNQSLKFVSKIVEVEVTSEAFPWFRKRDVSKKFRYPIAHRFGNFQLNPAQKEQPLSVLKYRNNPNGSFESIAGIYRPIGKGSFFGLMPHPERAAFSDIRLEDGFQMFRNAYEVL